MPYDWPCAPGQPPVFTKAADIPTDGSILVAIYEPEVGETTLNDVPFANTTGSVQVKRALITFSERGALVDPNAPATGWSYGGL